VPLPDSINNFTAAQMYINPITSWVTCTEILMLKPDDVLLVNACGSAIGRVYSQLSKVLGFRLIAVTRNNHHTEDLLHLGASYVIDTSTVPLYETVIELTNGVGRMLQLIQLEAIQEMNWLFVCTQTEIF